MPEQRPRGLPTNVDDVNIVGIFDRSLEADDQLFEPCLLVLHHSDVGVSDVKVRFVLQEEVKGLRAVFMEFY